MTNDKVKSKVIGVNIGSSMTTIAVVDLRGNILAQDTIPTLDYPNVNNFVEVLSERVIALAESNGGYENIRSVGMCAPSANYLTGCIENAANMPWKGIVPIAAMLRDSIGLAVALGNDAHVTALGERAYGVAHGMDNFIVVTLVGSGLGSCSSATDRLIWVVRALLVSLVTPVWKMVAVSVLVAVEDAWKSMFLRVASSRRLARFWRPAMHPAHCVSCQSLLWTALQHVLTRAMNWLRRCGSARQKSWAELWPTMPASSIQRLLC